MANKRSTIRCFCEAHVTAHVPFHEAHDNLRLCIIKADGRTSSWRSRKSAQNMHPWMERQKKAFWDHKCCRSFDASVRAFSINISHQTEIILSRYIILMASKASFQCCSTLTRSLFVWVQLIMMAMAMRVMEMRVMRMMTDGEPSIHAV